MTGTYVVFDIFVDGIWAQISVLVFVMALNCSIGAVIWIYLPEILPDIGVSFVFQLFWVIDAAFIFVFPIVVEYTSLQVAFGVFLAGCVVGTVFVRVWVKETNDKTNDEIIALYCELEYLEGTHK